MTLAQLNAAPRADAERALSRCCGSSRWVSAMVAKRPFRDRAGLRQAADDVWWSLNGSDWLEAFSHHPRIGDRVAAGTWSGGEQSGASGADAETRRSLVAGNHEYERKFGHVFLICATGKSAGEMLDQLRRRMRNDPATELRVAAQEHAEITRLRLDKLLSEGENAGSERR